jgi:uncharacterized protein (DUF58 family)
VSELPIRPTPALVRSLLLGTLLALGGIALGQRAAAVLAVPFVVHVAWALLTRTRREAVRVRTRPALVAVHEEDSVPVHLMTGQPGWWLTVSWPLRFGLRLAPRSGAVIDTAEATVVVEPHTWGRYLVGPPQVSVMDPSGSWRAAGDGASSYVVVRPAASRLVGSSGVTRPIGMAGSHSSTTPGEGSQLAELREFRVGDRLKRINWRVTSRTGRLHVATMLTERDTDVLLVMDTLHDVPGLKSTDPTSLDLAVRAVAALARHYLEYGDRVAVHDIGRRMRHVRAGSGPRQLLVTIDALSRIDRGTNPAYRSRQIRGVTAGTLVFFCSPLIDESATTEVGRLRQLGCEVVVVDTLPSDLGTQASLHRRGHRDGTWLDEAWVLRRLERDEMFARLRQAGVPVVGWRGTASLAGVLATMERSRRAPRMARRG